MEDNGELHAQEVTRSHIVTLCGMIVSLIVGGCTMQIVIDIAKALR